jgi:tRNAThr (cytosine32-N3)-methyltransferase
LGKFLVACEKYADQACTRNKTECLIARLLRSTKMAADATANVESTIENLNMTSAAPSEAEDAPGRSTTTGDSAPAQSPSDLSEIRNIAYHVQPPTIPNTRTAPIQDRLKRTDPFQFGSRFLEDTDDVFAWNAWDHVDPSKDELFVSYSQSQYAFQKENAASDFDRRRFNADPEKWWNKFYGNNEANFFKDRKWLRQEFPVLEKATCTTHEEVRAKLEIKDGETAGADAAKQSTDQGYTESRKTQEVEGGPWNVVLEIGAGAGNTAFPLVRDNRNPLLFVHACDFSKKAVQVMQDSDLYNPKHMVASQWDMAAETLPDGVEPGSVDVVLLIFAFSALAPSQWKQAVKNIWDVLRPGGELCFRDYGRGDLAQVRFKKGRYLGENFYVRGDGTRVYFFEEGELRAIFGGEVERISAEAQSAQETEGATDEANVASTANDESSPKFETLSLATDRRLLVNRQKQLKMYRCWQQGRFRKPDNA